MTKEIMLKKLNELQNEVVEYYNEVGSNPQVGSVLDDIQIHIEDIEDLLKKL